MRLQVALCLLAIFSIASAARTGVQAKLIHDGMGAKMQGRSLNKALTLMTEIHAELQGPKNGAEALLDALTALKDSISLNQADEIASFTEDEDHHRAEVARLQGEITKGQKSIIALTDEVQSYSEQEEVIKLNLDSQDSRLVEAKVQRDSTVAVIAKLDEEYEATKNDYGQCLQILDQAIEKINEAKGWGTSTMLLQKNRVAFKDFGVLLETTLAKRFDSIYYHPILNIFSQLTSMNKDDVDLNTVVQASNAILSLKNFLLDGLNLETVNYETTLKEYNDVLNLIKREIADLSLITIPNTQTTLDQVRETLAGKEEELDTTVKTVEFMKGALDSEEKTWVNRVQQNELLLPEYESEYNSVCQAESVIKLRLGELEQF